MDKKMATSPTIVFQDLGLIDYKEAWDYQKTVFEQLVAYKKNAKDHPKQSLVSPDNYLLFCEHPHVYTLGKSGKPENLLVSEAQLQSKGAAFYQIDRGGDITYHGPGQLVGYPILDLERLGLGIRQYVHLIEEAIIQSLQYFGIAATRLEGAPGIWVEQSRKICALGVRASRGITMHGFALNVNTNLDFFGFIHPCGFVDKGVTSIEKELGKPLEMAKLKAVVKQNLVNLFGIET
ncbi:lipoyl(octanoyl) transferase LipB [uncultured Microscilla sp.]|uniref:lipoyl(octanoyl) transferase LipB n=1 Tax=uncultured Microscilla sp. TaxID=432653 RepID=UPI002638A331|nr:lipoyl(octanoyl) transferase LipB [uncultured Microscilla sp.]